MLEGWTFWKGRMLRRGRFWLAGMLMRRGFRWGKMLIQKRKPDASDFLRLSPKTSAAILTFKKNTNRLQLQKTSRIRMNFEIDVQIRVTLYGMQIFLYVLP
jgi:hypothetical protein